MTVDKKSEQKAFPRRVAGWARSLPIFVLVAVPLAVVYLSTANMSTFTHIDPLTNALAGWHLGMTGSVVMPDHEEATADEQRGNVAWIIETEQGPVSQYPPGAAALAAPFYRIAGDPMTEWLVQGNNRPDADPIPFSMPSPAPAAIAASLAAAAAMGFLAATVPFAGGSRVVGIGTGYVAGLGTTVWATASDALWQHGPAALWLALGIFLAARSNLWWAGLAFGGAVLTRPPTALIAAGVGVALAISARSLWPAIKVGAGSLAGLAGLLWYNWWLFEELTVSGGYGDGFTQQLTSADAPSYLENLVRTLFDPGHGLLLYSPFLILLIPGLRAGWRLLPSWGRGAAVGGLVYLLVQLKANRSSGGTGFLGYRYPLEPLVAAGTLFALSYVHWVREREFVRKLFWSAVGIAMMLQVSWKLRLWPAQR